MDQWAHGQFADYVEHKAKMAGMSVQYVDEAYTTQRCPKCQVAKRSHKDGRKLECSECGYTAHRDAVGGYNIRKKYVSEETEEEVSSCLPGAMASPSGVRFDPHLQCSSRSGCKTNEPTGSRQSV